MDVIDIGAVPTPMVYFAAYHFNTGCGVAVTGSHNPPDYNGFKMVLGGETLSGDAIQELYARIAESALRRAAAAAACANVDVRAGLRRAHRRRRAGRAPAEDRRRLRQRHRRARSRRAVLRRLGCEVMPLFCDVDGTFPNHHPDPSRAGEPAGPDRRRCKQTGRRARPRVRRRRRPARRRHQDRRDHLSRTAC